MTEGYIKFNFNWQQKEIRIANELFLELKAARTHLYDLGLIGMYPDGIGFGNISAKIEKSSSFIVTGSATGQFQRLQPMHYSIVSGYSFKENSINCTGLTKASAESLTHAAVYEALPEISAVVHIHSIQLWEKLLNIYPTTSPEIEYGTPRMAFEVKKLSKEINGRGPNIIVMGGHREGILAFGTNLNEATSEILNIYNQYQND